MSARVLFAFIVVVARHPFTDSIRFAGDPEAFWFAGGAKKEFSGLAELIDENVVGTRLGMLAIETIRVDKMSRVKRREDFRLMKGSPTSVISAL
ncbi:MAG: hypothetical protein WED05_06700 [Candidatus Atabeyarchaeum deiterrae]